MFPINIYESHSLCDQITGFCEPSYASLVTTVEGIETALRNCVVKTNLSFETFSNDELK